MSTRFVSCIPATLGLVAILATELIANLRVFAAESAWRTVAGPVLARIVRVIDGDTLLVDAHPWPGHAVRVSVRLRGIDTPERRSKCLRERLAADEARNELVRLISDHSTVELINVSGGKYFGRVLADLKAGKRDVAAAMLKSGLARPYQGGKRTRSKTPCSS